MKKLILSLILCSGFVQAQTPSVSVRNFSFEYHSPSGQGTAAEFTLGSDIHQNVAVAVEKSESNFKFHVSGLETSDYEFKNAPKFLTDAESISISNLSVAFDKTLNIGLSSGLFSSPDSSLHLEGLSVNCNKGSTEDVVDQLISGCTQSMVFKTSKFTSESIEEALTEVMAEAIKINGVDLKVNAGKYNLSAEVKASVSGKVKSNGSMSYDASKSLLTLKISEVKFSIFNITGKVFDELKKKESDKFKVNEPYVYITVK
jgi:hypothetical protein